MPAKNVTSYRAANKAVDVVWDRILRDVPESMAHLNRAITLFRDAHRGEGGALPTLVRARYALALAALEGARAAYRAPGRPPSFHELFEWQVDGRAITYACGVEIGLRQNWPLAKFEDAMKMCRDAMESYLRDLYK